MTIETTIINRAGLYRLMVLGTDIPIIGTVIGAVLTCILIYIAVKCYRSRRRRLEAEAADPEKASSLQAPGQTLSKPEAALLHARHGLQYTKDIAGTVGRDARRVRQAGQQVRNASRTLRGKGTLAPSVQTTHTVGPNANNSLQNTQL